MNAAITTDVNNLDKLKKRLIDSPQMEGLELASSCFNQKTLFSRESKSKI